MNISFKLKRLRRWWLEIGLGQGLGGEKKNGEGGWSGHWWGIWVGSKEENKKVKKEKQNEVREKGKGK